MEHHVNILKINKYNTRKHDNQQPSISLNDL